MALTIQPFDAGESFLEHAKYCPEHECPLLPVIWDGQETSMCLYDIVEQLLGGQKVKYVKTACGCLLSIRFENGYVLEPLCPHCGQATVQEGGILENTTLVDWLWGTEEFSDGDYPSVVLYFAHANGEINDSIPMHLNSIIRLRKVEK